MIMTNKQLIEFKEELYSQIDTYSVTLKEITEELELLVIDYREDRVKRGAILSKQEKALTAQYHVVTRLQDLLEVGTKVDNEDFGLCEECKEEIHFEALKYLPELTHCWECRKNLTSLE